MLSKHNNIKLGVNFTAVLKIMGLQMTLTLTNMGVLGVI